MLMLPPPPPPPPPASEFVRVVDNPWFPLAPGSVRIYQGREDGAAARNVVRVTHRSKRIIGILATVVDDRVFQRGRLAERTLDYFAQDRAGNVWYLGEDTATLARDGRVKSREGTWRAGRGGGRAGILMPARPRPGDSGWQEYLPGHALDRYVIVGRRAAVRTPAARSRHGLRVHETSPLEPGVVDEKVYVRGIGSVVERTVQGGNERYRLVSLRRR